MNAIYCAGCGGDITDMGGAETCGQGCADLVRLTDLDERD